MKTTIAPEVLDVLKRCETSDKLLRLPGQLDRRLYVQVNQVLELLGAEWSKRDRAHVFHNGDDASEVVASAIQAGEVTDFKKLYQFFETPDVLAARMVQLAEVDSRQRVLEPSAGGGAIITQIRRLCPELENPIAYFELEAARARALASRPGVKFCGYDFLAHPPKPIYERIIANPPFRSGQDVDHVTRMYEWLAPEGRIVTITSPGWTYRSDVRHSTFRLWLDEGGHYREELPAGTFAASGTEVRALLLIINKPSEVA